MGRLNVASIKTGLGNHTICRPSYDLSHGLNMAERPLLLLRGMRKLRLLPFRTRRAYYKFNNAFSMGVTRVSNRVIGRGIKRVVSIGPSFLVKTSTDYLLGVNNQLGHRKRPMGIVRVTRILVRE